MRLARGTRWTEWIERPLMDGSGAALSVSYLLHAGTGLGLGSISRDGSKHFLCTTLGHGVRSFAFVTHARQWVRRSAHESIQKLSVPSLVRVSLAVFPHMEHETLVFPALLSELHERRIRNRPDGRTFPGKVRISSLSVPNRVDRRRVLHHPGVVRRQRACVQAPR